MGCSLVQRQFCASQIAYYNMKQMETLAEEVHTLKGIVETMQGGEDGIFDPKAQEGDGA